MATPKEFVTSIIGKHFKKGLVGKDVKVSVLDFDPADEKFQVLIQGSAEEKELTYDDIIKFI